MHKRLARTAWLAVVVLACWPYQRAHAGGLYLFDRGVRALGRGGAFVAGVDDPSALWYNPAGLAESRNQLLMDANLTLLFASFQRRNIAEDGSEYVYPTVKPEPTPLPIPTLALSHDLGLRDFTFGAGIFAPNTVILNWPRSVETSYGEEPSPTRYSLIGLKGSLLSNLALGFAYHGIDGLSLGAGVHVVGGIFKVETALSACDRVLCSFPEQTDFDAIANVSMFPAYGVTGVAGVSYDLQILRLGASVMLPYKLRGTSSLDLALPSSPVFADAELEGDRVDMRLDFPLIVRVGSELRLGKMLRMEGAFVWEQWSRQRAITIEPKDMVIRGVVGIGDYEVGKVSIPRNMQDLWSLRGGFEFFVPRRWIGGGLKARVRGGLAYEKSAFPTRALTPLTLDSDKVVLSGGLSIQLHRRLRFDTVLGYIFMKDLKVRDSAIQQPAAIRPSTEGFATTLGNGDYKMDALFLGGGFGIDLR